MKQVYYPYNQWECFIHGMWNKVDKPTEVKMISLAFNFTSCPDKYGDAMDEVINVWPVTMMHFLTNQSVNKKAHIGHCAVCYKHSIPEYITRTAWGMLTKDQQHKANSRALNAYNLWKARYENTLRNGKKDAIIQAYQMTLPKEFMTKFRVIERWQWPYSKTTYQK